MRLIDAREVSRSGQLNIYHFHESELPPYAILSHVWRDGDGEMSFENRVKPSPETQSNHKLYSTAKKRAYDLIDGTAISDHHRNSYEKICRACLAACQLRVQDKQVEYIWIDTVCIDKSNSAELAMSITSMFKWYQNSVLCIIYLDDFHDTTSDVFSPEQIRWFSRGWTLQELIAPRNAHFYNASWVPIGKRSEKELSSIIHSATGIDADLLRGKTNICQYSVAHRMAWAAYRETKEPEDKAYSLQGTFDVNIPPMYGEGGEKAFLRLQREIITTTSDMTIFAWGRALETQAQANFKKIIGSEPILAEQLFARDPSLFAKSGDLRCSFSHNHFALTNNGVQMTNILFIQDWEIDSELVIKSQRLLLRVGEGPENTICIPIRKISKGVLQRQGSNLLHFTNSEFGQLPSTHASTFYIATRLGDYRENLAEEDAIQIFPSAKVLVTNPVPQAAWNYEKFYFHNSSHSGSGNDWRALELNVRVKDSFANLAVIISMSARDMNGDPKVYLLDRCRPQEMKYITKIFSRRRKIDTDKWEDLIGDIPNLLKFSNTIKLSGNCSITTHFTKSYVDEMTKYRLDFHVEPLRNPLDYFFKYRKKPASASMDTITATSRNATWQERKKTITDPAAMNLRSGFKKQLPRFQASLHKRSSSVFIGVPPFPEGS